jgi:hypothetical protein
MLLYRNGKRRVTPVTSNIVLDAQVWAVLATEGGAVTFPDVPETVADMRTEEGDTRFTRQTATADIGLKAPPYRPDVSDAGGGGQVPAGFSRPPTNSAAERRIPAATVPALTTGESWTYGTDTHIAPAAWFVMAVNGFNPYEFK